MEFRESKRENKKTIKDIIIVFKLFLTKVVAVEREGN